MNAIRQFYYDDLYNRGASWLTAANNFESFTSDTMTDGQIYIVYLCVYSSVVAGGDGSNCGAPGGKIWPWALAGAGVLVGAVLLAKKK